MPAPFIMKEKFFNAVKGGKSVRFRLGLALPMILALAVFAAACTGGSGGGSSESGGGSSSPAAGKEEVVKLKFLYWGSNEEKKAVESMIKSFNESHSNIQVVGEHVPGDYNTKINTLMASNELPDVAYLPDALASQWGIEGRLLDFTPYMDENQDLKNRVPLSFYYSEPGKPAGFSTAAEVMVLYYNKDLFDEAGLPYPPAEADKAWTWEEFVEVARKLTKDSSGRTALDDGFDPNNIVQFGFSFDSDRASWGPFLASNGGDITDETGTQYALNSPEAVEVFQALQDLVFKYHVSPSLVQQQNLPNNNIRLQTRKVAMVIDGTWSLLDMSQTDMNFGIGVLPKFKEPKTMYIAGASVIFSTTKYPKEAIEFYKYHNNPQQVDLYKIGLWMPVELKYYEDPQLIESWTNGGVHPPEFKTAAMDYLLNNAVISPSASLKNWPDIKTKMQPALDKIFTNAQPVQEVLDELAADLQPLLQGKYPSE